MSAVEPSQYIPFSVSVVPYRNEVAVVPMGELDMASVEEIEQVVDELKAAGFQSIIVDLRKVDFIDSTGLRLLITLRNDAIHDGHALTLVSPGASCGRIFDITGTRGLFDWRDRSGR